jgi:hypothetical protein
MNEEDWKEGMHAAARRRRYVDRHWLTLLKPVLRYSYGREAWVLRLVGGSRGPVLRPNRRTHPREAFNGAERRGALPAR